MVSSICMLQISGQIVFRVTFPTVYIGKFNRQISHDKNMGNKLNKCTNIDMKMHEYHEKLSTHELFNFKSNALENIVGKPRQRPSACVACRCSQGISTGLDQRQFAYNLQM